VAESVTISSYNNKKLKLALGKGMNKIAQGTDEALMKVYGNWELRMGNLGSPLGIRGNGEWGIGRGIG
jgi:hypothetical protein